jgi:glycerate kinase
MHPTSRVPAFCGGEACIANRHGFYDSMARTRAARNTSHAVPGRILIAPDKFKGTLTANQAAQAIARGVRRAWPDVVATRFLLTDGGEGFVEEMVRQTGGRLRMSRTLDAVQRPCRARWGVLGNGRTAVVGLTSASGIAQLPMPLRDPEKTTNAGTGRLIARALREGYREILIGLGGSATNEGGISLAAAIGYQFLDRNGRSIPLNGAGLEHLARIVPPARMPKARLIVATDVNNPLYGPRGAAHQFARQKGADAAMVARLETGLRRLARIVKRDLGKDLAREPGAGSAGGCGYGLMTFFNAKRENGFQLIRRMAQLDALIRQHDLVITGEGCLDRTSRLGKGPWQLGELARRLKCPAWALCGRVDPALSESPFERTAALETKGVADSTPDGLTSAQHAERLEQLAFETASASPTRREMR